jgi:hypothetical protein
MVNSVEAPQNLKIELLYGLAIPLQGHTRRNVSHVPPFPPLSPFLPSTPKVIPKGM